jgi:AcrR family transcriptional regulator
MPRKPATRQLILEAVIACVEKYGLEHVTTRRIAQEAGTNIASINYHFRSKDQLISETLSLTINHMLQDVLSALSDTSKPFEATLQEVFRYLLDGSWRFPGISRAHLSQAVIARRKDAVGARAMQKVFQGLVQRAVQAYPRKKPALLRLRMAQIMESILFVLLTPDFFSVAGGRNPTSARQARLQAESYTSLFLRGI